MASRIRNAIGLLLVALISACVAPITKPSVPGTVESDSPPLQLVQTIPLPNVEGRIDHFSVDLDNQRLFIAALGNNTVEMLDLRQGKVTQTLVGFSEPQGVLFVPATHKLYVANGGSGVCAIFDGDTLQSIGNVELAGDADNLRYDANRQQIVVGYGNGAIGLIDGKSDKLLGDVPIAGHPEAFQLEQTGSRIFVNIPAANQIALVDRATRRVMATWPLQEAHANFPMALDEEHHRLFVGFRQPAQMTVYNTETGKPVATLDVVGDIDDIFYDGMRKRLYAIGGEGQIDVIVQVDADHYKHLVQIPTAVGTRTGFFVPEWNRLYVAVPHRGSQAAEIRVYALQPTPSQ